MAVLRHLRRVAVIWLALAGPLLADCADPRPETDTAVGIRPAMPFVTFDRHDTPQGLAIQIWDRVRTTLEARGQDGLIGEVEFIDCPSIEDQGAALAEGRLDVVISPLTITAERMEDYDFSQQYLGSGITVMQRSSSAIDFAHATATIVETLLRPGVVMAVAGFLAFNLVVAYLMYWALKIEGRPLHGRTRFARTLSHVLETVIRTAGLKGAGDFKSAIGRILEIFMAVVGTALSATIFGVLTSAFVGAIGQPAAVALTRLPETRIATLEDSTSQTFLEATQAQYFPDREAALCAPADAAGPHTRCLLTPTWVEAVELLANGKVAMVLGDWVQLSFLANIPRYAGELSVQGRTYLSEPYGWGIAPDRQELRRAIDSALIEEMRQPSWRKMIEDALGTASISPE